MPSITLTLELPLSDHDRAVLSALATAGLGDLPPAPVRAGGHTPKPESVEDVAAPKTEAKPAPKAKKAPAKKAPEPEPETPAEAPAPEPAPEAPAPEPAPEAPAKGTDGPTVDDAVARAASLLSEGRADAVKAALASLDINRVSQLKPSQVGAFLEALDA